MAIHFLETENAYQNRVLSIRVAIFFCFILRALLCGHWVAFKRITATIKCFPEKGNSREKITLV